MKDYQKKIDTLKDIIKLTEKKGRYYGHHFIIVNDEVFHAVRYGRDLDYDLGGLDDYKHLSIEFNDFKHDSNKYYVIDSQEGEIHQSHFDARLIDVDTLYHVLKTIKES